MSIETDGFGGVVIPLSLRIEKETQKLETEPRVCLRSRSDLHGTVLQKELEHDMETKLCL